MKNKIKIILLFASILLFTTCKPKIPDYTPPEFPKSNTYAYNAYKLNNDTVSSEQKIKLNWWIAAKKVSLWRYLINSNIANTYFILNKCNGLKFKYLANKTWYCEKDIDADTLQIKADLYGTFNADSSVLWELYASVNNQTKVLLLRGESDKNLTQGYWTFFKQNQQVIKIEWNKEDTIFDENFFLVDSKNIYAGSFCKFSFFRTLDDTVYHRMNITFYNSTIKSQSKVRLDLNNFEGAVSSPYNFKDSLWHCWNSSFDNIICK